MPEKHARRARVCDGENDAGYARGRCRWKGRKSWTCERGKGVADTGTGGVTVHGVRSRDVKTVTDGRAPREVRARYCCWTAREMSPACTGRGREGTCGRSVRGRPGGTAKRDVRRETAVRARGRVDGSRGRRHLTRFSRPRPFRGEKMEKYKLPSLLLELLLLRAPTRRVPSRFPPNAADASARRVPIVGARSPRVQLPAITMRESVIETIFTRPQT